MEQRYIRNIGPLTKADCACLRNKRVLVAGCGGLGGYILDMLLRVGVGHIAVADGDVFELSNLNRQLLCNMELIGTGKAEAAAKYAHRLNPYVSFTAYDSFITKDNVSAMVGGCDVVVDALDSISCRKLLKAECDRENIPYIYGAINGWVVQTAVSMPGDGLLDRLYPGNCDLGDTGSLPFTAAMCASLQCASCVKLLCGKPLERSKLFLFDLSEFDFETLS